MEDIVQQSRPAEQAMVVSLSSAQLVLVANWLREEVSLFEKAYGQADKRVRFVADRLVVIAQESAPKNTAETDAVDTDADKPWRFSDEYWEKYEANDD